MFPTINSLPILYYGFGVSELSPEELTDILLNGDSHEEPCDEDDSNYELQLPDWYDPEKYKRGQRCIQVNLFSQIVTLIYGLSIGLALPSVINVFIRVTNTVSIVGSFKRYISTAHFFYDWFHGDLSPNKPVWKLLAKTRKRHGNLSKFCRKREQGIISQRDMVFSLMVFSIANLRNPKSLRMKFDNREDIDAYLHFWAVIGHLLGIKEKYNICRRPLEECIQIADTVFKDVIVETLQYPPEYSMYMTSVFYDSLWFALPLISYKVFDYLRFKFIMDGFSDVNNRPKKNYSKFDGISTLEETKEEHYISNGNGVKENGHTNFKHDVKPQQALSPELIYNSLGFYHRSLANFWIFVNGSLIGTYIGRKLGSALIKSALFFAKHFPFLMYCRYGFNLTEGKVSSKGNALLSNEIMMSTRNKQITKMI